MRRRPSLVAILATLCVVLLPVVAWVYRPIVDSYIAESRVAQLGGIGREWIETLRAVVGEHVVVDTLTQRIIDVEGRGGNLLGLWEGYYDRVRINTDLGAYLRFSKNVCGYSGHFMGYQHPSWLAYPAAVLAHEFGHQYQSQLPEESEWRSWHTEIFADRFAAAMLQLRGWMPLDTTDAQNIRLRHELRYRLIVSRWPRTSAPTFDRSRPRGSTPGRDALTVERSSR